MSAPAEQETKTIATPDDIRAVALDYFSYGGHHAGIDPDDAPKLARFNNLASALDALAAAVKGTAFAPDHEPPAPYRHLHPDVVVGVRWGTILNVKAAISTLTGATR